MDDGRRCDSDTGPDWDAAEAGVDVAARPAMGRMNTAMAVAMFLMCFPRDVETSSDSAEPGVLGRQPRVAQVAGSWRKADRVHRVAPNVRLSLLDRSRTRAGRPGAEGLTGSVDRAVWAEELVGPNPETSIE